MSSLDFYHFENFRPKNVKLIGQCLKYVEAFAELTSVCYKAVEAEELNVCNSRSICQITYSQADLNKFPTRERFQDAAYDAFEHQALIHVTLTQTL